MKKLLVFSFLVCSLIMNSTAGYAQALKFDHITPPFPTVTERKIANAASWGTLLTTIALDTHANWNAQDRTHALEMEGARLFVSWGFASIIKTTVGRERPCGRLSEGCGSDNTFESFYSLHTAFAFSTLNSGPSLKFEVPLVLSTGGLRIAAGRHYLTDVLAGAAVGAITSRIR